MRKSLLLALAIVMCSSLAFAQGGNIDPYWDAAGTNCYLTPAPGLCYTYVFHEGVPAAGASEWRMDMIGGWSGTYIAYATAPYLNILSAQAPYPLDPRGGISIAYGNPLCEPLPALICTVTWLCSGAEPLCSGVTIVADPLASIPSIEVRDCLNQAVPAGGGSAYVDASGGAGGCGSCAPPVPVQEQTWGQIKSLYN
jgi:hypothetical protein